MDFFILKKEIECHFELLREIDAFKDTDNKRWIANKQKLRYRTKTKIDEEIKRKESNKDFIEVKKFKNEFEEEMNKYKKLGEIEFDKQISKYGKTFGITMNYSINELIELDKNTIEIKKISNEVKRKKKDNIIYIEQKIKEINDLLNIFSPILKFTVTNKVEIHKLIYKISYLFMISVLIYKEEEINEIDEKGRIILNKLYVLLNKFEELKNKFEKPLKKNYITEKIKLLKNNLTSENKRIIKNKYKAIEEIIHHMYNDLDYYDFEEYKKINDELYNFIY